MTHTTIQRRELGPDLRLERAAQVRHALNLGGNGSDVGDGRRAQSSAGVLLPETNQLMTLSRRRRSLTMEPLTPRSPERLAELASSKAHLAEERWELHCI